MDATHLHLLINHIPILGSFFCLILLIIGLVLKNKTVEVVALSTLLVVALFTLPAYFTGEEAEHDVEHFALTSEHELEEHEEHAETTLWLMIASGLLAAMALVSYKYSPHLTKWMRITTLVILALTALSMIPLALHGGKIIRPELRGEPVPQIDHDH
jgi:glucan phosphoethanolaminetransferase (alkaline phosphatase superfamily)